MDEIEYWRTSKRFVEKSRKAKSLKELTELFWSCIKPMGCKHFICASSVDPMNPPPHAIILTNYPITWTQWHSDQEYYKIDPVFKTVQKRFSPFKWSDERWRALLTTEQSNILNEATEVDIVEGITFPVPTAMGYPASVSVVFEPGHLSEDAILSLELMSQYLYESALSMKVRRAEWFQTSLTPKQREVLQEIANGKSTWDTSVLAGISENTVKTHVKGAFEALNAHSRPQAVAAALFRGEISFQDIDVDIRMREQEFSEENIVIIQP